MEALEAEERQRAERRVECGLVAQPPCRECSVGRTSGDASTLGVATCGWTSPIAFEIDSMTAPRRSNSPPSPEPDTAADDLSLSSLGVWTTGLASPRRSFVTVLIVSRSPALRVRVGPGPTAVLADAAGPLTARRDDAEDDAATRPGVVARNLSRTPSSR